MPLKESLRSALETGLSQDPSLIGGLILLPTLIGLVASKHASGVVDIVLASVVIFVGAMVLGTLMIAAMCLLGLLVRNVGTRLIADG